MPALLTDPSYTTISSLALPRRTATVRQSMVVRFLIGEIVTENVGYGEIMETGWSSTQHPLYFLRTHSRAS